LDSIADYGIVEQLARHCGPDVLLALIDEGFLKVHYLDRSIAIKTENTGTPQERHKPATIHPHNLSWKLQNAAPVIFQQVTGKQGKGRRLGNHFAGKVKQVIEDNEIFEYIQADYANSAYVKDCVKRLLQMRVPDYQLPRYFHFHVHRLDDQYLTIDTDLDFVVWKGQFHLQTPSGLKSISPAGLLVDLFEARRDLQFSSLYGGEIATNPFSSALIRVKCDDLLSALQRDGKTIDQFQEQVLERGHAICDVVNSGERGYKDVLKLLQRSRNFRHWLHEQEPNINLGNAYYKEVIRSTWVESLPVKAFRWFFLLAAGVALLPASPIVGLGISEALSTADSFLVDRLLGGWKPNQFVDGPLASFLDTKQQNAKQLAAANIVDSNIEN